MNKTHLSSPHKISDYHFQIPTKALRAVKNITIVIFSLSIAILLFVFYETASHCVG